MYKFLATTMAVVTFFQAAAHTPHTGNAESAIENAIATVVEPAANQVTQQAEAAVKPELAQAEQTAVTTLETQAQQAEVTAIQEIVQKLEAEIEAKI